MALPDDLQGDTWTRRTARTILPLLVAYAKRGECITYGDLDREIVRRRWGHHVFVTAYGHPAGRIGDALVETSKSWGRDIPPINAIIVNQHTGVPGNGCDWYLRTFHHVRRSLSDADRLQLAKWTHDKVFNFPQWDKLLREYGLNPAKLRAPRKPLHRPRKPRHSGWSNEGESQAHKQLADLIARDPAVLGLLNRSLPRGIREAPLAPADRPDVMFRCRRDMIAVEVKSHLSNDTDLERGVFQCVKYRAILKAEQTVRGEVPNGWAMLATARSLPDSLRELAQLLDVPFVQVNQGSA